MKKGYQQFKGILSSREYFDGIKLCLQNASSLLEEAEILLANQKHARAYFLATTSLEEIAKVQILLGLMIFPNSQQKARDDMWKDFYNHSGKYKTIAEVLVILNRMVNRDFDHNNVTEPIARSEFNRMASLYVEYSLTFKKWRDPNEFVNPEAAEVFIKTIKKVRESFGRWVEIINPDMFDVFKNYLDRLVKKIELKENEHMIAAIQKRYMNVARELFGEMFVELFQKGLINEDKINKFNKEMDEFNRMIEGAKGGGTPA